MTDKTYLEDLQEGDVLRIGEWWLDPTECAEFAERWEPQPYHLSEEAGRRSLYGRMTVCSVFLFAVCTRLFFDYEKPIAVLGMLGKNNLALPNPAFPGERLWYETRCQTVRASQSRPDSGIIVLEDQLVAADDQRVVLSQDVTLLVARRPTA